MDTHLARLIISIEGNRKSYILYNGTEAYYKKLRSAYLDIKNDKHSDYLYFGFFTLCAATLEYSLNFILTDFCLKHFGQGNYKTYAKGYINLSFPTKLTMTPNIISNGSLIFKEQSSTFKTLLELISLRNKILHNKEFLQEFDFPEIKEDMEEMEFEIKVTPNHIDTLNKEKCLRFGHALGNFKKKLMLPFLNNSLSENEMLARI